METFTYHRPTTLADATAIHGAATQAAYLAGGATLVLLMRNGYAAPTDVIDLRGLPGLAAIEDGDSEVHIGALVTHDALARSALVQERLPALASLADRVGDPQVRNQGTVGGAVATNDPAGDYPPALIALGARIHTDRRTLDAESFFTGRYQTALAHGEVLTRLTVPIPRRAAYEKIEHPASRYALVGVMAAETDQGPRVAATGVGPIAARFQDLETLLERAFSVDSLTDAVVSADGIAGDRWGSADYRANLVTVLTRRAVEACTREA